jgi:hypothetical protein
MNIRRPNNAKDKDRGAHTQARVMAMDHPTVWALLVAAATQHASFHVHLI